jgi:Saxitoxin biosynthesis operon protein SxtJ
VLESGGGSSAWEESGISMSGPGAQRGGRKRNCNPARDVQLKIFEGEVTNVRDKYFGSHELHQRAEVTKTSSDRTFGLVFAVFSALLGALSFLHGTARWPIWFSFAAVMLILALAAPKTLAPFNWAWTKLGLLLHAFISPVVLAILFYVCIAPIGFLMRLSGTDPLRRYYDADAESYWIARDPPGPQRETFRNQF